MTLPRSRAERPRASPRRRLERWAFTAFRASDHELAAFRMVLASYLTLRSFPQARAVQQLPGAFFDPPLGLPALFSGFVSEGSLLLLHGFAAAALLALLLGYRTQLASYASFATLVLLSALTATAGKIDHVILLLFCPVIMAGSGWGHVWSVDALRRDASARALRRAAHRRGRWQLAWLALTVTMGMATAGLSKLYTGWLDPHISATYGHAVANAWLSDRHTFVGDLLLRPALAPAWEGLDWLTVLFELLAPLALLRPQWLRGWCVMACGFHLGVGLTMDIWFAGNAVVYSAFLPWQRLLPPPSPTRVRRLAALGGGFALVLVAAAFSWRDERAAERLFALRDSIGCAVIVGALPLVLYARIVRRRAPARTAAMRVA